MGIETQRTSEGVKRVLKVFERSYGFRSDDFYRAHLRNEAPAADVSPWHREIWSGAYRQWLRDHNALDETWSMRASPGVPRAGPAATPTPEVGSRSIASPRPEAPG